MAAAIVVLPVVVGGHFLLGSDVMRPDPPQPALNVSPPVTTPPVAPTD